MNNRLRWTPAQLAEFERRQGSAAVMAAKPAAPAQPKGRTPNKTERAYHDRFLLPRIQAGEVVLCLYEALTFRLAHDTRYTPDWCCWLPSGEIELIECKGGHTWDDAKVKIKVAAAMFPHRFTLARKAKGGEWIIVDVPGKWTEGNRE
jgi:hypothetical protein